MRTDINGGAAAPGLVTPAERDDARELWVSSAGTKGQGRKDRSDYAAKLIAAAIARAAAIGIEVHEVVEPEGAAWLPRHAHGADIALAEGPLSISRAVAGFEAAHNNAELVRRMRGAR